MGVIPEASGDVEWEMNSQRAEWSVEIEDVPVGSYMLVVDSKEVGTIRAVEMHGRVVGMIRFRDPEVFGKERLDFDPRGRLSRFYSRTTPSWRSISPKNNKLKNWFSWSNYEILI